MEKKQKNKYEEVIRLLKKQQIRDVKDLDSYKLSICHPSSAGIDLGSRQIYVALNPVIAAEMGLPIVHVFDTFTSGLLACRKLAIIFYKTLVHGTSFVDLGLVRLIYF